MGETLRSLTRVLARMGLVPTRSLEVEAVCARSNTREVKGKVEAEAGSGVTSRELRILRMFIAPALRSFMF